MGWTLRGGCRGGAQNEGVVGTTPADVMQLMMVSQYTDMLKDVGGTAHSTVFVPNGASAVGDIQQQMRQGFMEANAIERQQVRPIQGGRWSRNRSPPTGRAPRAPPNQKLATSRSSSTSADSWISSLSVPNGIKGFVFPK